jgi:hypothetical protein
MTDADNKEIRKLVESIREDAKAMKLTIDAQTITIAILEDRIKTLTEG